MPQGNSPRRQRLHMHLCWRSTGPCPETCLCLPEGAEPLVAAIHQASSLSRQPSGTVIATLNGYATSVSQDETELGAFRTMNCDILAAPRVCRAKQQCTFGTLESTQLPNYRKHFPVCATGTGERAGMRTEIPGPTSCIKARCGLTTVPMGGSRPFPGQRSAIGP